MEEKQKKPIFKRWWFWVIAVIVVFAIAGGGDKDSPKESVNVDNPEQVEQKKDESKEEPKEEEPMETNLRRSKHNMQLTTYQNNL